jgi:hypothetical protein
VGDLGFGHRLADGSGIGDVTDPSTDNAILEFILHLETKPAFSKLTRTKHSQRSGIGMPFRKK